MASMITSVGSSRSSQGSTRVPPAAPSTPEDRIKFFLGGVQAPLTAAQIRAEAATLGVSEASLRDAYVLDQRCQKIALAALQPLKAQIDALDQTFWDQKVVARGREISSIETKIVTTDETIHRLWEENTQLWEEYDQTHNVALLDAIEKKQNLLKTLNEELFALRDRFMDLASYKNFLQESHTPEVRLSKSLKQTWDGIFLPFKQAKPTPAISEILKQSVLPPLATFSQTWQKMWIPYFRTPEEILRKMQAALRNNSPLLVYFLARELDQEVYANSTGMSIYAIFYAQLQEKKRLSQLPADQDTASKECIVQALEATLNILSI